MPTGYCFGGRTCSSSRSWCPWSGSSGRACRRHDAGWPSSSRPSGRSRSWQTGYRRTAWCTRRSRPSSRCRPSGGSSSRWPRDSQTPGFTLANLASVLIVIYVVDAAARVWRGGDRRRAVLVGGSVATFIVLGGIHAPLVDAGLIETPYMISFAFLAIVLALSYELVSEAVLASRYAKEVRASEARWRSLLTEVQLAVIGIDSRGTGQLRQSIPRAADRLSRARPDRETHERVGSGVRPGGADRTPRRGVPNRPASAQPLGSGVRLGRAAIAGLVDGAPERRGRQLRWPAQHRRGHHRAARGRARTWSARAASWSASAAPMSSASWFPRSLTSSTSPLPPS